MRQKKGIVISAKQDKTLVVTVHRYKSHPKYKKKYRISKKFHVHNPNNEKFETGAEVTFYETRPISKLKKWTLVAPKTATKS
jgi:small subunit ribosomal protein S17